jgi:hypothetical protein
MTPSPPEPSKDMTAIYVLIARMFRQPSEVLRSCMAQDLCRVLQIGPNAGDAATREKHFTAAGTAIAEDISMFPAAPQDAVHAELAPKFSSEDDRDTHACPECSGEGEVLGSRTWLACGVCRGSGRDDRLGDRIPGTSNQRVDAVHAVNGGLTGGWFLPDSQMTDSYRALFNKTHAHAKRARWTNIVVRKDAVETTYEADWIKRMVRLEAEPKASEMTQEEWAAATPAASVAPIQQDSQISVNKDSLRQLLQALAGPGHLIREMQATMGLSIGGNPLQDLIKEFNDDAYQINAVQDSVHQTAQSSEASTARDALPSNCPKCSRKIVGDSVRCPQGRNCWVGQQATGEAE